MKQIYTSVKAVITALTLSASISVFAQSPTTTAKSNACNVVEDFNSTSGGFRAPSIFTESNYTEFNWDATNGYWIEKSGQNVRSASLISPLYLNDQMSGGLDIGFKYLAGKGGEYRVRVLNVECSCIGGYDIIATTAVGDVWTKLPEEEGKLCIRINDADIIKGQKLRFEISFRNNQFGDFIFDDLSLGQVAASPLPVTFMGIVANRNNNDVNLKWEVGQEVNVSEYEVERSLNGGSFTTIGTVSASGKTVYTFADITNDKSTFYYRLKSVDNDGRTKYSGIIKVKGAGSSYSNTLKLYPLPARNEVTLEHKKLSSGAQLTLNAMDGRAVKVIHPSPGASHTPIDLSNVLPGIYLVRLSDGEGNVETVKLVKQ